MLIRKKSGEVIEVETEEIMDASDFVALIGREDDPLVVALVSEIRRMNSILANQPQPPAPVVNVSPYVHAPAVSVSPNVTVDAPRKWRADVTEHFMTGQLQGKIKTVEFTAL
jgi:hypothetical protein